MLAHPMTHPPVMAAAPIASHLLRSAGCDVLTEQLRAVGAITPLDSNAHLI
jgi:hypothetical protein